MSNVDSVIRSVAPLQAGQLQIARLTFEPFTLQRVYSCELEFDNLSTPGYPPPPPLPPSPRHTEFKFSVIEQEAIDAGITDV